MSERTATAAAGAPASPDALDIAVFQLRQGALLAPGTALPPDEPVDRVSARAYRHPLLGERIVVKLAPNATATAMDVEMGLLGFGTAQVDEGVALRRRQSLGFPGWALVHDPKRAKLALDVMSDFKTEARRASSKPGHAKDGFQAIANRLSRSVPHFLPSFWEEAGRVFIDAGNLSYAAQVFEKARQAEAQHQLDVDEDARATSFLEFALAGALAVKSLSAYARSLEAQRDPAVAYKQFYGLAVRRTLGGMAPWASMPADLRRLAKAAGRDVDDEDERLLEDVLDSPALARAPAELWRQYRPALVRLAARSPRVRGLLLNLMPSGSQGQGKGNFAAEWMGVLEETGALEVLDRPEAEVPVEARPAGGTVAWLRRLIEHLDDLRPYRSDDKQERFPEALFRLLRRLAPRLKADGTPLSFEDDEGYSQLDVDILDLLLELGVPVADPGAHAQLNLRGWASGGGTAAEPRPRDPVHVARDERFAPLLARAYEDAAGEEDFDAVAADKQSLLAIRERWLHEKLDRLGRGGLAELRAGLSRLEEKTKRETFAGVTGAHEKLAAVDVARALALTLRTGILDEYGWPELEAAHRELVGARKKGDELEVGGAFPYLVLHNQRKVIVLGPRGRVVEHDLRIPKGFSLSAVHYLAGQLLVVLYDQNYNTKAYWSARPTELFKPKNLDTAEHQLELPDGSVTLGGRAISAGDTHFGDTWGFFSDGSTVWVEAKDGERLEMLDPRTGQRTAAGGPSFLVDFAEAGWTVDWNRQVLRPAPAGMTASPLGLKNGLLGLRVRARDDHVGEGDRFQVERIDGARWEGVLEEPPIGLMDFPGAGAPAVLTELDDYDEDYNQLEGFEVRDPKTGLLTAHWGGDRRFHRATPLIPPRPFLHYFRPRDPAGSAALRRLTDEQAAELLRTAIEERGAGGRTTKAKANEVPEMPRTDALVARLLPEASDPGLRLGVRGLVELAADVTDVLKKLVEARRPSGKTAAGGKAARAGAAPADAARLDDSTVHEALGTLSDGYPDGKLAAHLAEVSAFLAGGELPEELEKTEIAYHRWIGRMRAVAFRAVAALEVTDSQRSTLLDLLELWAGTFLAEGSPELRVVQLKIEDPKSPFLRLVPDEDDEDEMTLPACWAKIDGDSRYVAFFGDHYDADEPVELWVLERAAGGRFRTPKGAEVLAELKGFAREKEWLLGFVDEARRRGPVGWEPAMATRLAASTGLSRAEAALLAAGLPRLERYEHDFLGKELRTQLELKVNEARAARESLRGLDVELKLRLFAAAAPEQPAALWSPLGAGETDESSVVARLGRAFLEARGPRVEVPDEVLLGMRKDLTLPCDEAVLLAAASDPEAPGPLHGDGKFTTNASGDVRADRQGEVFTGEIAQGAALFIAYMNSVLAVGQPLRAGLPRLHALVLERLKHPDLLITIGCWYADSRAEEKRQKELFEALAGEPYPLKQDADATARAKDTGALIVIFNESEINAVLRPARLRSYDDPEVSKLARLCDYDGIYDALAFLASPGCAAMMRRIETTPVPKGGWEQNPAASAPKIVQDVSKALDVGEDAAVLYLQTLALPDPTSKNVQRWNDWNPARYAKAVDELVKKKLLVSGKRQRAGREAFLPGGWENLKAPNLPLESWKLALYGVERGGKDGTQLQIPMGHLFLRRPAHEMFAEAWGRVQRGDKPAYEAMR